MEDRDRNDPRPAGVFHRQRVGWRPATDPSRFRLAAALTRGLLVGGLLWAAGWPQMAARATEPPPASGGLRVVLEALGDAPRPGGLRPWARADRSLDALVAEATQEALGTDPAPSVVCHGQFRVENHLGRDIGFLALELAALHGAERPARLFTLAVMPVRRREPARVVLPIAETPCAAVTEVVLTRLIHCADRAGQPLDCGPKPQVASDSDLPFNR